MVRPTSEHATFLVGYVDVAPNVISRDNVERSIFHVYEVLRIIKLGEPSFIFFFKESFPDYTTDPSYAQYFMSNC